MRQRMRRTVRAAWLIAGSLLASDVAQAQYAIDARATGVGSMTYDFDALGLANYAPVPSVSGILFENAYYGGAGLLGTSIRWLRMPSSASSAQVCSSRR